RDLCPDLPLQPQPRFRMDPSSQGSRTSRPTRLLTRHNSPRKAPSMSKTRTVITTAIGAVLLAGCGSADPEPENGTVHAVSTFSILTDIVEEVGGDHVEVHNLVPVGQDPHEYDATPDDSKALADADVFFYNGLNLEGGDDGWAARMADTVEMDDEHRVETTEGVEPMYLTE